MNEENEIMKINEHDLKSIGRTKQGLDQLYSSIGMLTTQLISMGAQANSNRLDLENSIKESLLRAGVKEPELQFYAIDSNTGEIKDKRTMSQQLPQIKLAPEPASEPDSAPEEAAPEAEEAADGEKADTKE